MDTGPDDLVTAVDGLLRSRKTIRAFRQDPVPRTQLVQILEVARTAPSTFNTQPWRVHVVVGEAKRALSEALLQGHVSNTYPPYSPFPEPTPSDCSERQGDFRRRYYAALGIDRSDMAARSRQTARNYVFFDAPVGLIFTIDAALTKHSWLDCGLFLQNLIIAAHARGLATCSQVSFVRYQLVIAQQLGLASDEAVVCGMSLGYAAEEALLNRLEMPREPVAKFTNWHGFDQ